MGGRAMTCRKTLPPLHCVPSQKMNNSGSLENMVMLYFPYKYLTILQLLQAWGKYIISAKTDSPNFDYRRFREACNFVRM